VPKVRISAALMILFVGMNSPAAAIDSREQYVECIAKLDTDPRGAFDSAAFWRFSGGGIPAAHCAGLALIRMGQHTYGAERLETTVRKMQSSDDFNDPANIAEVLSQAGHGWMLASDPTRARQLFTKALEFKPGTAKYFVDRSLAATDLRDFRAAASDLDAAVKFDPENVEAYAYRARSRRLLNDVKGALSDVERAISLDPNNVPALLERGSLRRLTNDNEGARADWKRVVEVAPESAEAIAAGAMIKALQGN
jgi:tetratricopeptide (TPR) repeat protein